MRRRPSIVALVAVLALFAGCSGDGLHRAPVSGEVLVDNEALFVGMINFFPTEGTEGPSAGATIKDGKFSLAASEGAIVGKNLVKIVGFRKTGKQIPDVMDKTKMIDEQERAIGPEYNEDSKEVREIKEGPNVLKFDLKGLKK